VSGMPTLAEAKNDKLLPEIEGAEVQISIKTD
jgi:hypothetical protein